MSWAVSRSSASVAEVERFHRAGLAHGGRSAQAPRRWEIYRPGYFGAIVTDPDGNLVEAASTRH